MKKLIAVCIVVGLILIASSTSANTTTSSTMWFEGGLEKSTGVYTGTIGAARGYYYVAGGPGTSWDSVNHRWETPDGREAEGGFDVYAKDGATAYLDLNGDGNFDGTNEQQIITDHDARSAPGPWGTWYNPDVPNYWNYHLELTETTWRVWAFDDLKDNSGYYETPLEGTIDWSTMIATETGANWNPTWTWGEENIPLQYSTFTVGIIDDSDGESTHECTVSLTPFVPAPGAILLGGIGVGLVAWLRRRRTL